MDEKTEVPGPTPAFSTGEAESMRLIRRSGAMVLTGICLVVAVGYTWMAFEMPGGSLESPGAGTWPRIVGVAWIAISVIAFAESFKRIQVSPQDLMPTGETLGLVLKFFAATVVYVVAIPFLGVYISSSVYAVYTIRLMRQRWTLKSIVIGVIFGVTASFIFVELLEVRLPSVPW